MSLAVASNWTLTKWVCHSYTVTVIAGLIRDDPPQQPMPLVLNENTARIGAQLAAAVGLTLTHGDPDQLSVVNGQLILNSIGCPHIVAEPIH